MKAKDLIKILTDNPDAEIVHFEYTGGDTPVLSINNASVQFKGEKISGDRGHFIDKNGILEKDVIILGYNPNKNINVN